MENSQFDRTFGLIEKSSFFAMKSKCILIAGLGGVGGTTFESLVRTGFDNFVIVDFDVVSLSNLNRQILFTHDDLDNKKVDAAKTRAIKINPSVKIVKKDIKIDAISINEIDFSKIDIVIDCIDDVGAKVVLAKKSQENNVKYVSSMGMANKVDPTKIKMMKLNKTTSDPLARKIRYQYKQNGIDISKIDCVASIEEPTVKGNALFSLMHVTSSAGLILSSYVISYFKEIM